MWAADPPNAVVPSRRKTSASSFTSRVASAVRRANERRRPPRAERAARGTSTSPSALRVPSPEPLRDEHGDLRGRDGDRDVDEKQNRSQPGQQADEEQSPEYDLDDAHEGGAHLRNRNGDVLKAPDAECRRKEKLLDPLGQEDGADENAYEHVCGCAAPVACEAKQGVQSLRCGGARH